MINIYLLSASKLLKQNVIALIEGSNPKISACVLSTVTSIPLIRLHGYSRPFEQCEQAIKMPAEYSDHAHATLDIIYTFRWGKIALVFDGKTSLLLTFLYCLLLHVFSPVYDRSECITWRISHEKLFERFIINERGFRPWSRQGLHVLINKLMLEIILPMCLSRIS